MMHPMATSAILPTISGRYWFRRTSGRPINTSVVPWPRPHRKPMVPALRTLCLSSPEAIRVVTAARWSGSEACRKPRSRLTSNMTPTPTSPCKSPSNQPSIADMRPLHRLGETS
jgi:hypothetical protein